MSPVINKESVSKPRIVPRVLVVDDEPDMLELVGDVVGRAGNCRLLSASSIAQAEKILAREKIDLLLVDMCLPDGDGMALLNKVRREQPFAAALIITGNPSVNNAIGAIRAGVVDFLPKPFSADHLLERVTKALEKQTMVARKEIRLTRLKGAVKKLNVTRHTISKKVDLLCNDLVSAYGELSRQLDAIRMQESFRKLLGGARDLEQMLCHAMDWILRQAGYCNVAIWLASEEQGFELGAYMKYSIPGDPQLTDAMRLSLLPTISREGTIHLFGPEMREALTPVEYKLLAGQEILGCNCTYLGESLAAVVMFRDEKSPFNDDDISMLKAISPIFAVALANIVRRSQGDDSPEDNLLDDMENDRHDEEQKKKRKERHDSDWWKRGEPPPF